MSNIIEIKHQDSQGKSAVELIDLLNLIAQDQQQLVWSILDLEAIGDLSPIWERGILDLEENIRNLPQGLILSWQMLILLVEKFDQVINIIIVGCQEILSGIRYPEQFIQLRNYLRAFPDLELIDLLGNKS